MDIVTLVHDETHVPEPLFAKVIIEAARTAAYANNKVHITDEEMATFLIVLGASLLVWESA
jgi:hypothetical protein